jgi:hypothetical protein
MNITNLSPRLLSIAAPGHGLGVLLLVPLERLDVPPELEQLVRAALEGPLRTFVAQGGLDIEEAPPTAAELQPALERVLARVVDLEAELEPEIDLELEPEIEPPPPPAASRAKRR